MNKPSDQSLLLIFRQAPYGRNLARDALDVALASAAFIPDLAVLFMGDGVYQILSGQDPEQLGLKRHAATLEALPIYGVEHIYVHEPSLHTRGLDSANRLIEFEPVGATEVGALIERYDAVLSF